MIRVHQSKSQAIMWPGKNEVEFKKTSVRKMRLIMKKTTPAIIATSLITTFLVISMLLVGQDALSSSHGSTAAVSQNQAQSQLVSFHQ
jgi:hypothetical protein